MLLPFLGSPFKLLTPEGVGVYVQKNQGTWCLSPSPCAPLKSFIPSFAPPLQVVYARVEEAPEGGYTARALGESIFAEAHDLPALHQQVRDAVRRHFEEGPQPKVIRLHFVREDVIAV